MTQASVQHVITESTEQIPIRPYQLCVSCSHSCCNSLCIMYSFKCLTPGFTWVTHTSSWTWSGNSNFLDYSGRSVRLWSLLTHDAFLWCWGDDVAYVQVLGGQFTVQTQEITETPFYWKLIGLKQRQGGLEDRLKVIQRETEESSK